MAQKPTERMSVSFGSDSVVVRRDGSSAVLVAKELGRETLDGNERIYLDRLVHERGQDWKEFRASGAISTILTRSALQN